VPEGASMVLRRKADGTVHLAPGSEFPDHHSFNARQISRELEHPYGSMFNVFVVLHTESHGDVVYKLTGYGDLDPDNPDDDRKNYGTMEVERVGRSAEELFLDAVEAARREGEGG
jgi:hypothetical protein